MNSNKVLPFSFKATGIGSGELWSHNFLLPKGSKRLVGYTVYDRSQTGTNNMEFELILNDNRDILCGNVQASSTVSPSIEQCNIKIVDTADQQLIIRNIISVDVILYIEY